MQTARAETIRLAALLRHEHEALAEFLAALAAFDEDRRWSELGYTSLFGFLVRELGLSKGAAFYRNRAAELVRKFPAVLEALRDGRLCLSSVGELSSVLTAENVSEVLPRYFHLSRSEAKEVTAELRPDPAPVLRTIVTVVPAPGVAAAPAALDLTTQAGFPENLLDANSGTPDVVRPAVKPAPARAEVDPLTADLRRLHLTVSRRLLEKLATARDALSHSQPNATDDEILELGLDLIVERHRRRRGIGAKPRKVTSTSGTPSTAALSARPPLRPRRSRHVPAAVWRAVWERDGGKCQWPLENGGVCGSTHQLELDHVDGFALGGDTTVERTRLLCRPHQDVHARALYGNDHMNAFTRPRGAGCSEPVASYGASLRLPVVPLPLRVAAAVAPLVAGRAGLAAVVGLQRGAAGAGRTDDDAGRGREGQDGQRGGEGEGLHGEAEGATRGEGGARWDRRARRRPLRGRIPA